MKLEWVGGPYDGGHTTVPQACMRLGYLDIQEPQHLPPGIHDDAPTHRTIRLRIPITTRAGRPVLSWEGRQTL